MKPLLATKYPWIYGYFLQCTLLIVLLTSSPSTISSPVVFRTARRGLMSSSHDVVFDVDVVGVASFHVFVVCLAQLLTYLLLVTEWQVMAMLNNCDKTDMPISSIFICSAPLYNERQHTAISGCCRRIPRRSSYQLESRVLCRLQKEGRDTYFAGNNTCFKYKTEYTSGWLLPSLYTQNAHFCCASI